MARPRLLRGLILLLAGEGISRLLSFLAIALLARRLGDVNWAPVAVALTITQFGALLVESGMRLYGAREVARDHTAAARIAPSVVATQVIVGLVLLVCAVVVDMLGVTRPELGRLLPGYAVSLIALPFFVPWIFQGLSHMEWVAAPQAIRYGVFLVLCVFLVREPAQVAFLPWLEALSMAVGAGVAMWVVRRLKIVFSVTPSRAFDAAVLRESIPIWASQVLWVVRMYLPILLLWKMSAEQSVARFDLAHRVMMVMQAFLTVYLVNLFTSLSQEGKRPGPRFFRLLFGSTALAALGALLVAFALSGFAGSVLGILYSEVFRQAEATRTLALLAFLVPVLAVRGHGHFALVALGRQRTELACSCAGTVLLIAMLFLWVPERSAVGAAQAMLVSEVSGALIIWLALLKHLRSGTARELQPLAE